MAASLIDWDRAERVAIHFAHRRPFPPPGPLDLRAPASDLEDRIEKVTGLRSAAGTGTPQLIDRATWIRANITSFQRLLEPLLDSWQTRLKGGTGTIARQIAGAELGTMLGWMSTRVLGQYDLLFGRDGGGTTSAADGAVYLVGPNLAAVEHRFGFDPAEFRSWVLLHELTHRAQFTGVPWMREHFSGLVDQSLAFANPSPGVLASSLKESLRSPTDARQRVRDGGLIGLVASPEQRALMERIGGLMSLLEGHGDVTMTRAAGGIVPSAERFAHVLAVRRKQGNPLSRLVQRLIGLEAKLDQYAAGERFIAAIENVGGERAVDRCWERPEHLPSLHEIRDPQRWAARMESLVA